MIAETATAIHIDQDDDSKAFRGLVTKLERAVGVEDLEGMFEGPRRRWKRPRNPVPATHGRAMLALKRALAGDEHAYVSFGYMMARAEAEDRMLVPAAREKKLAAGRAKGGESSKALWRTKTDRLRAMASKLIDEDRSISRGHCSRLIADMLAEDVSWGMSTDPRWIARQISELFEPWQNGDRTEYRPKSPETTKG